MSPLHLWAPCTQVFDFYAASFAARNRLFYSLQGGLSQYLLGRPHLDINLELSSSLMAVGGSLGYQNAIPLRSLTRILKAISFLTDYDDVKMEIQRNIYLLLAGLQSARTTWGLLTM
ncbi:hypothetical protein FRC09_004896 [Ceratobasidium sp. 395]|nr:hypothetical protein FRC09_004896 [Ceratobasidium sp. 395]